MSLAVKEKKSLDCHDRPDLVDSYVESDSKIQEETARKDNVRSELDDHINKFRRNQAESGLISNTFYVRGSEATLTYSFQNRFKNAPTEYEKEIDEQLGSKLRKQLFTRSTVYKVRTNNIEGLKEALGPRFNEFVESAEVITPVSGFRTKVLQLRNTLSNKKKAALDFLEEMFCHRPTLKS